MFVNAPSSEEFPVPILKPGPTAVRGLNDDCIPPKTGKQDPVVTAAAAPISTRMAQVAALGANPAQKLTQAVSQARQHAQDAGTADSREFVSAFADDFRAKASALTNAPVNPVKIDRSSLTDKMYENYKSMIVAAAADSMVSAQVFIGNPIAKDQHPEVVSLNPGNDLCTGVIIARNAIATAGHCAIGAPQFFRIGDTASRGGRQVAIGEGSKFIFAKTLDEKKEDLDMAIIVLPARIKGIDDKYIPLFASSTEIDSASKLTIFGFGGNVAAPDPLGGDDSGLKRFGTIPIASADCKGPGEKEYFNCHPDFDLVAGARPLADRASCPTTAAQVFQHGACNGDSGGPAYVTSGSTLLLAGLIRSINENCGCAEATNVYVRFDRQLPFLRDPTKGIDFPPRSFAELAKRTPAVLSTSR
jgi:hypothetical protein